MALVAPAVHHREPGHALRPVRVDGHQPAAAIELSARDRATRTVELAPGELVPARDAYYPRALASISAILGGDRPPAWELG